MRATRSPRALGLAAGRRLAVVVLDLARGHFLERDREVVLRARLDHRRRELVERALAEVVVVGVDLPRALGGDDDAGVVRVDVRQQAIDAGRDQDRGLSRGWPGILDGRPRSSAAGAQAA